MPAYRKPHAVVLTGEGVFYSNEQRGDLRIGLGDALNLAEVMRGAEQLFMGGEGVVMVDATVEQAARTLPELGATEWKFTELRAWTTLTRDYTNGQRTVIHLGLSGSVADNPGALLNGAEGPADVAWRLGRYHDLTGHAWRYTAGVSGCFGLRQRWQHPDPGKQPLWRSAGPRGVMGQGPMVWNAAEQPAEGTVDSWDVNAMYLGGIKNARVAWSELKPTGARGFDAGVAGWWEIDVATVPGELWDGKVRPPLFWARRVIKGTTWLSTERAKLVEQLTGTIDVVDSWTCDNTEAIGRGYAERLASVRTGMLGPMGPAARGVKRTWAELVGMVAREGGSIHRPDWSAAWMDLSCANMLRRVFRVGDQLGVWPVAIRTDAVHYANADVPVLGTALGMGDGVGLFKKERTLTVDQYRADVLGGRR